METPTLKARGACPGVWSPMQAGDGWILRVRVKHSRIAAWRLRELTAVARAWGNGIIELTRRANLQIRGVRLECVSSAQRRLRELELAESPERERQPGLLVCPLSGLDARCPPLESMADHIDDALARASGLSHKAGVVLSTGSSWCAEVAADVHVRVRPQDRARVDLAIGGTLATAHALGVCEAEDVSEAVHRILSVLGRAPVPSMRAVLGEGGSAPFLTALGTLVQAPSPSAEAWSVDALGFHDGAASWVGSSVPFGSAGAEDWSALADVADRYGDGELRLTPVRHVLLPGVARSAAAAAMDVLEQHGFRARPRQPELELVACSGAPACLSAHGDARRLALELADVAGASGRAVLHVSGCEKGCARSAAADVTVVLRSNGCSVTFDDGVRAAHAAATIPVDAAAALIAARRSAALERSHAWPGKAAT